MTDVLRVLIRAEVDQRHRNLVEPGAGNGIDKPEWIRKLRAVFFRDARGSRRER